MTPPKLSTLTVEDKCRLAAELDGYDSDEVKTYIFGDYFTLWKNGKCEHRCPDYPNSYDAIIPLIQKLGKENAIMFADVEMHISSISKCDYFCEATPPQLLDAVLVAAGKAVL